MSYSSIHNQLTYIAANGNYNDIFNTLVLLKNYTSVFTTGQVPTFRKVRDGIQSSSVSNLESLLTGNTSGVNALPDFNVIRNSFIDYVAKTNLAAYSSYEVALYQRIGLVKLPVSTSYPVDIEDCQGTLISSAVDKTDYIRIWNTSKVDVDYAICGVRTSYLTDAGGSQFVLESATNPDNHTILYNKPGVLNHIELEDFEKNREAIVDLEAQVKPKSINNYYTNN